MVRYQGRESEGGSRGSSTRENKTNLPLERINNYRFAWLNRYFGVKFLSGQLKSSPTFPVKEIRIKRFDKTEQTNLPLERINNFWFAWLGRHFGVQFLSGLSSRGHHVRVQTFHLKKYSGKMVQKADFWRLGCFFSIQWSYFFRRFHFWFRKRRDLQEIPKSK